MLAVILPSHIVDRGLLTISGNISSVVVSFVGDECWTVDLNVEKLVFGIEEISSVFSELSTEDAVMLKSAVTIPSTVDTGMVSTELKIDSVEEGDVGIILKGTSAVSEAVQTEEAIVPFEVDLTYATDVKSNADIFVVIVVLGITEGNKVENDLPVEELLGEIAVEPLTDFKFFSNMGPAEVSVVGHFKQPRCVILEDLVIGITVVSVTCLEIRAVTLTGNEDI